MVAHPQNRKDRDGEFLFELRRARLISAQLNSWLVCKRNVRAASPMVVGIQTVEFEDVPPSANLILRRAVRQRKAEPHGAGRTHRPKRCKTNRKVATTIRMANTRSRHRSSSGPRRSP